MQSRKVTKARGDIYAPQIGNIPKVMPSAAEKASCLGSVPLQKGNKKKLREREMLRRLQLRHDEDECSVFTVETNIVQVLRQNDQ